MFGRGRSSREGETVEYDVEREKESGGMMWCEYDVEREK